MQAERRRHQIKGPSRVSRQLAACYGEEWHDNPAAGLDWGLRERIADAPLGRQNASAPPTPHRTSPSMELIGQIASLLNAAVRFRGSATFGGVDVRGRYTVGRAVPRCIASRKTSDPRPSP